MRPRDHLLIFVGLEGKNTVTYTCRCFCTGELALEMVKRPPAVSVNHFIRLNDSVFCVFFVLESIKRASGFAPSTRCCPKGRVDVQ